MKEGAFIVSLDLEIHWGVSDHRSVDSYRENLRNVPAVVNRLLDLFAARNIHATWATVGFLFCKDKQEIFDLVDSKDRPSYDNPALSNYHVALDAGEDEQRDPYHFASSLIRRIVATPGQELATHTFSHYYCLEPGQTTAQFKADLQAALSVAGQYGSRLTSMVFPRNQYDSSYLEQCRLAGLTTYRGNYPSALYRAEAKSTESYMKRLGRLADAYLPVNGQRTVEASENNGLVNVPASAFLRPFNKKLSFLESIRLNRMKKEMESAAIHGRIYHLWWHPHNFGAEMEQNFRILEKLLNHFDYLKNKYGMKSFSMQEMHDEFRACKKPKT